MQYDEKENTLPAGTPVLRDATIVEQPVAAAPVSPQPVMPRSYMVLWTLTTILTVITLISLAVNILVARQLFELRRLTRLAVYDSIAVIQDLQAQTYTYNVVVDDTFIVDDEVAFRETIPVHIDETMPFGTSVTVPVDIGPFGRYPVNIPIGGAIPVKLDFDVPVDETIPVYIEVPIYTEIPIEVTIANTPLYGTLVETEQSLEELGVELDKPLFWFLDPRNGAAPEPN